jgi:hypothetical protein
MNVGSKNRQRVVATTSLIALVALSGCTAGVMQTSRQLKDGEVILSGVADEPGFYVIPRLSANVAYGLGDVADINANLGTTVLTYSGGVGLRVYPTDWATLSVQGNYGLLGVLSDRATDGILSITGKLTSTTKIDGRPVYGGLSMVGAGLRGSFTDFNDFSTTQTNEMRFLSFSAGLVGGIETDLSDDASLQVELSYMPIGTSGGSDGVGVFPISVDGLTPFIIQFGVAIHYRIGDEPAAKPTKPVDAQDPDALPPRPSADPTPTPAPVPTPAPTIPEGDGPEAVPVP